MPNLFPADDNLETVEVDNSNTYKYNLKKSYAFDFEKGEFITKPDGGVALVDDLKAYEQWCTKGLLTKRYSKDAYSDLYGNELHKLINSGLNRSAIQMEIERMVSEALMVHPRTKTVNNFTFDWKSNDSEVIFEFDVYTKDEEQIKLNSTMRK